MGAIEVVPWVPFAGIGPADVASFVERVELADRAAVDEAFSRWQELEREGWDVTALVDRDETHMVGLGCLPLGQMALGVPR